MCGIAGFFTPGGLRRGDSTVLERMTVAVRHRGPDDQGVWLDPDAAIALGHRRLSIIDLSSHGHQPMQSASGRFILIYNGEIYNFSEIRAELRARGGFSWRSVSAWRAAWRIASS